jgi:hypothetical protein
MIEISFVHVIIWYVIQKPTRMDMPHAQITVSQFREKLSDGSKFKPASKPEADNGILIFLFIAPFKLPVLWSYK